MLHQQSADELDVAEVCSRLGITCHAEERDLRASLDDVAAVSELFRALSDETRTKIVHLLAQRELCVCDLACLLRITLPAVSHHLRLLKALRLVRSRRRGKQVFYALDDDHVRTLIAVAQEHYSERGVR